VNNGISFKQWFQHFIDGKQLLNKTISKQQQFLLAKKYRIDIIERIYDGRLKPIYAGRL